MIIAVLSALAEPDPPRSFAPSGGRRGTLCLRADAEAGSYPKLDVAAHAGAEASEAGAGPARNGYAIGSVLNCRHPSPVWSKLRSSGQSWPRNGQHERVRLAEDQLLRMIWLNDLVSAGAAVIGLASASRIGGAVRFFVYDVIKIFILLSVLIFAISYVQSHFPPERTRAMLGGRSGLGANTLAALLLGTLTPSVPVRRSRSSSASPPLAVTFSFLISWI